MTNSTSPVCPELPPPGTRDAWVMSACTLARQGLVAALHGTRPAYRTTVALTGLESTRSLGGVLRKRTPALIVVWLPAQAACQRAMVRLLTDMLRRVRIVPEVIILGEGQVFWVWLALLRETRNPDLQDSLRFLDARRAVSSLQQHLARPWGIPLMKMRFASVRREVPVYALSTGERRVLEGSLSGVTMAVLGAQLGVSPKTLYAQRYRALEKLGLEPPASDYWLWHLSWLVFDCGAIPVPDTEDNADRA